MKKTFKTGTSALLALFMMLSFALAASNYGDVFNNNPEAVEAKEYKQKFWDVPKNHWVFESIAELTDRGAINGYPDGSYKPNNTVTRAEWAKIMIQAAGLTADDYSVKFADMKGHWAAAYVNAASNYLTAFSDGRYRPDQAVTREDVTMAMVKLKGYDLNEVDYSVLSRFKDVASISNHMKVYVAIAVEKGLINGFEDETFRGQATLTRAQAATLLWRAFQFGNDNKVTADASVSAPSSNNTQTPTITDGSQGESSAVSNTGAAITVNNLEGVYQDSVSKRAHMEIKKINGIYKVNIGWSSSAKETTEWFFDAEINKSTGDLVYTNGYEYNIVANEDGTTSYNLRNDECEGSFEFIGSQLIWNDRSEDLSERCKFEKGGNIQRDYAGTYAEAKKAIDKYLKVCMNNNGGLYSYESMDSLLSKEYNLARGLLLSCFGYQDSDELIEKLAGVHDMALQLADSLHTFTYGRYFTFHNASTTMRDSMVYMEKERFMNGSSPDFSLKFSYDKKSFNAEMTNLFTNSFEAMRLVVSLFADNYKDAEFDRLLWEAWKEAGQTRPATFNIYYGGYNFEITYEDSGYSYTDITIKGEKGAKKAIPSSSSDDYYTGNKPSATQPSTQPSTKTPTPSYEEPEESKPTSTLTEKPADTVPSSNKTYRYYSYYAEYIIDERNSGSVTSFSKSSITRHIESSGGTMVGEIKLFEKTLTEDKGDSFYDETDRLYYSVDKYLQYYNE